MEVQIPLGAGLWWCRAQAVYPDCHILPLSLSSCVTWGLLPNLSVPQLLVYSKGIIIVKYLLLVVVGRVK